MTEDEIRAGLDGTFRRINRFYDFVTDRVPIDYEPTQVRPKFGRKAFDDLPIDCRGKFKSKPDFNECQVILDLRSHGYSFRRIGSIIGRDPSVVRVWCSRWKGVNPHVGPNIELGSEVLVERVQGLAT